MLKRIAPWLGLILFIFLQSSTLPRTLSITPDPGHPLLNVAYGVNDPIVILDCDPLEPECKPYITYHVVVQRPYDGHGPIAIRRVFSATVSGGSFEVKLTNCDTDFANSGLVIEEGQLEHLFCTIVPSDINDAPPFSHPGDCIYEEVDNLFGDLVIEISIPEQGTVETYRYSEPKTIVNEEADEPLTAIPQDVCITDFEIEKTLGRPDAQIVVTTTDIAVTSTDADVPAEYLANSAYIEVSDINLQDYSSTVSSGGFASSSCSTDNIDLTNPNLRSLQQGVKDPILDSSAATCSTSSYCIDAGMVRVDLERVIENVMVVGISSLQHNYVDRLSNAFNTCSMSVTTSPQRQEVIAGDTLRFGLNVINISDVASDLAEEVTISSARIVGTDCVVTGPRMSGGSIEGDNGNMELDPNELWVWNCEISNVPPSSDPMNPEITDDFTVEGTSEMEVEGMEISVTHLAFGETSFNGISPSLRLEVNGVSPTTRIVRGETLHYTYELTNDGSGTVNDGRMEWLTIGSPEIENCMIIDMGNNDGNFLSMGEIWTYDCSVIIDGNSTVTATLSGSYRLAGTFLSSGTSVRDFGEIISGGGNITDSDCVDSVSAGNVRLIQTGRRVTVRIECEHGFEVIAVNPEFEIALQATETHPDGTAEIHTGDTLLYENSDISFDFTITNPSESSTSSNDQDFTEVIVEMDSIEGCSGWSDPVALSIGSVTDGSDVTISGCTPSTLYDEYTVEVCVKTIIFVDLVYDVPNDGNNCSSLMVEVIDPSIEIDVVRIYPEDREISIGDPVDLHIRVSNTGNTVLTSIEVTDIGYGECNSEHHTIDVNGDAINWAYIERGEYIEYICWTMTDRSEGLESYEINLHVVGIDRRGGRLEDSTSSGEIRVLSDETTGN